MNVNLKRLGVVFAMGLGLFSASGEATADTRYNCDMSGVWVEDKDSFQFSAAYIAKDGPDTFTGVYTNASAGAVASVNGVASNGTWVIALKYTDAKHRGYEKSLLGTGTRDKKSNSITIKGTFNAKKDGREVQKGTFSMIGKCK